MILHACRQGSEEWQRLRCGKVTASMFERVLTPTGKLSAQSRDLLYRLAAERILQYPLDTITTAAMDAGRYREPEAANWYSFEREVELEEAGICFTDDGRIGASPDRFVSGGGLLEIKCPMAPCHVGYLLTEGIQCDYKPQIQGQLYVCEAEWLDSVSYCPPFTASLVRVERDEAYIAKLADALSEFCDRLDEAEAKLSKMMVRVETPMASAAAQQVWDEWRPTL